MIRLFLQVMVQEEAKLYQSLFGHHKIQEACEELARVLNPAIMSTSDLILDIRPN